MISLVICGLPLFSGPQIVETWGPARVYRGKPNWKYWVLFTGGALLGFFRKLWTTDIKSPALKPFQIYDLLVRTLSIELDGFYDQLTFLALWQCHIQTSFNLFRKRSKFVATSIKFIYNSTLHFQYRWHCSLKFKVRGGRRGIRKVPKKCHVLF